MSCLDSCPSEIAGLHRRIPELQSQLAKVEAQGEEERRGKAEALAKLDRKVTNLEAELAAEGKKLEFEREAKEQVPRVCKGEKGVRGTRACRLLLAQL